MKNPGLHWRRALAGCLASFALSGSALAVSAQTVGPVRHWPDSIPGQEMPLYSTAPASATPEIWEQWNGMMIVRNVSSPTLTAVLPRPEKATGAAILIVPGGGLHLLVMDQEGWTIAQALADRGIAAFVLKYRVEPTPGDDNAFNTLIAQRFDPAAWIPGVPGYLNAELTNARTDAQAALRLIRAGAGQWKIDPHRVGMLGFSAGAITTVATAVADLQDARPDFIAPLYGVMLPVTAPSHPQPLFVALADDDPTFSKQGFGLVESWQKAGGSVELHWYEGGGHGFSLAKQGRTSDLWFEEFMAWMQARGFLKTVASEQARRK